MGCGELEKKEAPKGHHGEEKEPRGTVLPGFEWRPHGLSRLTSGNCKDEDNVRPTSEAQALKPELRTLSGGV